MTLTIDEAITTVGDLYYNDTMISSGVECKTAPIKYEHGPVVAPQTEIMVSWQWSEDQQSVLAGKFEILNSNCKITTRPVNPDAIEQVKILIMELGMMTVEKLTMWLTDHNYKGVRGEGTSCPIAMAIKGETSCDSVAVSFWNVAMAGAMIPLPEVVSQFVYEFDHGRHHHLDALGFMRPKFPGGKPPFPGGYKAGGLIPNATGIASF